MDHHTQTEAPVTNNRPKLFFSALAFASAFALAIGTSPNVAMASDPGKVVFESCPGMRPIWCAPGTESDMCNSGAGVWYFGCINNGGAS
jgi:hypothetical protein